MKRCMFTVGPRTRKGVYPVFFRRAQIRVGWLCERWGKGAGWFSRPSGSEEWDGPHASKAEALSEMGKKL